MVSYKDAGVDIEAAGKAVEEAILLRGMRAVLPPDSPARMLCGY